MYNFSFHKGFHNKGDGAAAAVAAAAAVFTPHVSRG